MQSIATLRVDPPVNWQDFEHLCWLLWHDEWNDPGTQKNGRQGQAQHGVDVFGQPKPGSWVGIQCKGKDDYTRQQVTEHELRAEVIKAKTFRPALADFILATTAPRDAKVQEVARMITAAHQSTGEFTVRVCSWDDIRELLGRNPRVVGEFYAGAAFAKDTAAYAETLGRFLEMLTANQQQYRAALDAHTTTMLTEMRLTHRTSIASSASTAFPDITETQLESATKRFKSIRTQTTARHSRKSITTAVLPPNRQRVLALVAVAPMHFTKANFEALFPQIDWNEHLAHFVRRGLVVAKKGRISVPGQIRRSFLSSDADRKPYLQEWIDTLLPLNAHPDAALYLALQQLHSGQFKESVCTIIDTAAIAFPGQWNRIYLSILLNVNKPHVLKRFSDQQHVRYLNSVALCLLRERRFNEAIRWFTRLRSFSKRTSNNWGIGQSYHNCGITFIEMGEFSRAEGCLRKAVRHTKKTRDSFLLGRALYELGIVVAERSDTEAAELLAQSEQVKHRARDYDGLAGVHHGNAVLAVKRGEYREAVRHFKRAERAARQSGNYHGQALETFNIGRAYLDLEEHETALRYLRQAMKMADADELTDVLLLAVGGAAMALSQLEKHNLAEKAFRRLFQLHKAHGNMADAIIALHDVGATLLHQRRFGEGRTVLASAGALARRHSVVEWIYQCYADIGTAYIMEGLTPKAISLLRRYARHAEQRKLYGVAASLWADVASITKENAALNSRTEEALEKALEAANKAGDPLPAKLRIHADIHVWRWQNGDFEAALTSLRALLECAEASHDRRQTWVAHNQLGVCLQELGRFTEALTEHRRAVRIARQLGDPESLERSLNNLGEALRRRGRYVAAISVLEEGENLAQSRGDSESAISIAHNRGLAIEHQRRFDDAKAVYEMCRDHSRRYGWWSEYVRALHALANLEWHRGSPVEATLSYAKALNAADRHNATEYRAGISLNYANALRWQKQTGRALAVLKSAEEQFRNVPDAHTYYSQLAALYDEIGDATNATKYWQLAYANAKRVNDEFAIALSAGALAEEHDMAGRPEQADDYCRLALEHENDPELRATLLVQRLSLLLQMGKEKEASEVFAEIEAVSSNKKASNEYVDALLLVGDHNWKDAIEEGVKAYIAAMSSAAGSKKDRFFEIGCMLADRLVATGRQKGRPRVVECERSIEQWLRHDHGVASANSDMLLWPFRVAARVSHRFGDRSDINEDEWGEIVQEEVGKLFT